MQRKEDAGGAIERLCFEHQERAIHQEHTGLRLFPAILKEPGGIEFTDDAELRFGQRPANQPRGLIEPYQEGAGLPHRKSVHVESHPSMPSKCRLRSSRGRCALADLLERPTAALFHAAVILSECNCEDTAESVAGSHS